jgi:hypothetical protein
LTATLTGACLAVPYLLMIDYAAPRFLLPAYAVLAIPVAEGVVWLATVPHGRPRPVVVAVLALALGVHLAVQFRVLARVVERGRAASAGDQRVVDVLRRYGVRRPCVLSGNEAIPLAYVAGCASRESGGADRSITPSGLLRIARAGRPVAVLVSGHGHPPAYARGWRRVALPSPGDGVTLRGYLAPRRR